MSKETVSAGEVLGDLAGAHVGTFVQRAGVKIAAGIGGVIVFETLAILLFLYLNYPAAVSMEGLDPVEPSTQALVQFHHDMAAQAMTDAKELFQILVIQSLLPVFTLTLGYVFAKTGGGD